MKQIYAYSTPYKESPYKYGVLPYRHMQNMLPTLSAILQSSIFFLSPFLELAGLLLSCKHIGKVLLQDSFVEAK